MSFNTVQITTSFGTRPLLYFDYTATARPLESIDLKISSLSRYYGNPHSQTGFCAKRMQECIDYSFDSIKKGCNAHDYHLFLGGNGSTDAIKKFQEIVGISCTSSLRKRLNEELSVDDLFKPIVYVSMLEHHSNYYPWANGFCELRVIPFVKGTHHVDVELLRADLKKQPSRRLKIGFFSASSNVTGVRSDVAQITSVLKEFGALACFDFSVEIVYGDLNFEQWEYPPDAVVFSAHKLSGGAGGHGVLFLKKKVYAQSIGNHAPTHPSGGTVRYSSMGKPLYYDDPEIREQAGTQDPLAICRTALAIETNRKAIPQSTATHFFNEFMALFAHEKSLIFYGETQSPRNPIIAFNIAYQDSFYHPGFVATLLNDLFGIQVRSGCFCASPFVQYLFAERCQSEELYAMISKDGHEGFKKGMVRLSFHHETTVQEFNYLVTSLRYIIENANRLLSHYSFSVNSGQWVYWGENKEVPFSLETLAESELQYRVNGDTVECLINEIEITLSLNENMYHSIDTFPANLQPFCYFPVHKVDYS